MAEFSDAQVKQLLHWSAAGETPRSILAHLADETRDGVGLSPWPDASENEIEVVLHEHRTQRITLFARRLVPRVGLGGLAGRGSQAAATIDRIHVLDRQIAQCDAAFEELMRAGAFRVEPFISEERLDEVNAIYTQTFGGAVRNKDGSRAIVIARPNGERYHGHD
jgi:hypothetical protein